MKILIFKKKRKRRFIRYFVNYNLHKRMLEGKKKRKRDKKEFLFFR